MIRSWQIRVWLSLSVNHWKSTMVEDFVWVSLYFSVSQCLDTSPQGLVPKPMYVKGLKFIPIEIFIGGGLNLVWIKSKFWGSKFYFNKPIGALPLTKCHFFYCLFRLRRILGGVGGEGLKKGRNALWAMESQRCKSSTSRKSFQHCLLHHTPCCLLSWQSTISRVSTIPNTHTMSLAVMLYIHTLPYAISYC